MSGATIRLLALASGQPTGVEGHYVAEYDPDRRDHMTYAHIVTTPDRAKAKVYPSTGSAWDAWRQQSTRWPKRADGKPNRPLTAFTVEIEKVGSPA